MSGKAASLLRKEALLRINTAPFLLYILAICLRPAISSRSPADRCCNSALAVRSVVAPKGATVVIAEPLVSSGLTGLLA